MDTATHNEQILARLRGLPARAGTAETDMDAGNPNAGRMATLYWYGATVLIGYGLCLTLTRRR